MKVQSPPGAGALYIPLDGDSILVGPDESVEVPETISKSLLGQGWLSPDTTRTVAATLEWVGEDVTRAQAVLAEEQANDDPRSTLVSRLEAIIDKETS